MIVNYKFENFMSFRENAEFSMMAPKTKVKVRFPNNYITAEKGGDILKTAVIVGENAGGKSNFVESLRYFKSFFGGNENIKAYRNTVNINNIKNICPKDNSTCQIFEIEILLKGKFFYLYHLEIDYLGIVKEELSYKEQYKKKYKSLLTAIRKEYDLSCDKKDYKCKCTKESECNINATIEYSINVSENREKMEELLKKAAHNRMGLYVIKLALLGNEHAVEFTKWIINNLCPETNVINYDLHKSIRSEEEDLQILNDSKFIEIFKMVDPSIIEIEIDEEDPFIKSLIRRKKRDGNKFSRVLGQDSSGVREFFAWAIQIFKVIYEDKIIFADEMDRVLNPVLSDKVIAFICGKTHYGQFIFTTHNILHLNLKNLMKEQIYFITKDIENCESELYSLADFPEVRYETTKIYEFYMKGILGGTVFE